MCLRNFIAAPLTVQLPSFKGYPKVHLPEFVRNPQHLQKNRNDKVLEAYLPADGMQH
jgi:hypothetical protein